jgi:hypothetical protein
MGENTRSVVVSGYTADDGDRKITYVSASQ